MEKLEVGQVWVGNDGQRRKITKVISRPSLATDIWFDCVDKRAKGAMWEFNFHRWITRTGAKLEGKRDGEA